MAENVTLTWWSFVNRMCTFPVNFSWILGSNLDWDWWKTLGLASFIHPFHSLVVSFHQGFYSSRKSKIQFHVCKTWISVQPLLFFPRRPINFLIWQTDLFTFCLFPQRIKFKKQQPTFCIFVYVFLESRALDMVHYFKKGVLCLTIPFWSSADYGNVCIFLRHFCTNT